MGIRVLRDGVGVGVLGKSKPAAGSDKTSPSGSPAKAKSAPGAGPAKSIHRRLVVAVSTALSTARRVGGDMLKDENGVPHLVTRGNAVAGLVIAFLTIIGFFLPYFMTQHDNALRMEIRQAQLDTELSIIKNQIAEDRKSRTVDHDIIVSTALEVRRVTNWLDASPTAGFAKGH